MDAGMLIIRLTHVVAEQISPTCAYVNCRFKEKSWFFVSILFLVLKLQMLPDEKFPRTCIIEMPDICGNIVVNL